MEAIKLLNEAVDAKLVLQLITDKGEDFFYREYYLVSRGKEQILLLSSNEEYYDGNLEIIRTEDNFLRSFHKSPYPKSHLDILPNYADYSILGGDLFFLDFLEQDFVKKIDGYHEDCFSPEEREKAIGFAKAIPILKEKARNNIGNKSFKRRVTCFKTLYVIKQSLIHIITVFPFVTNLCNAILG